VRSITYGDAASSPIALALFALSPPSILIGLDGCRFAVGRGLETHVQIAKQEVRAYFSGAHLAVSRLHKGFTPTFSEQPRKEVTHANSLPRLGPRIQRMRH